MGRTRNNLRTYSAKPADYKLLEEVGYGASATVYRAIYLPFNEVVAVKCLDLDRCNNNLVVSMTVVCTMLKRDERICRTYIPHFFIGGTSIVGMFLRAIAWTT